MKRFCRDCGVVRVRRRRRGRGMQKKFCGKCSRVRLKESARRSRELRRPEKRLEDREYQRRRRADNPGLKAAEYASWRRRNPERCRAHMLTHLALKKGVIRRLPCEVCGEGTVHAHHPDPERPLLIAWLCPVHHVAAHQQVVHK